MTGNGLYIPTIYGDDWGMVHCYTRIITSYNIPMNSAVTESSGPTADMMGWSSMKGSINVGPPLTIAKLVQITSIAIVYGIYKCSMYPPVIKHGVLENEPFIGDVPIQTSIQFGDIPAGHVWLPEGMGFMNQRK